MELREWLIILGLILMAIIVIDGVRRLQRQRHQSSRLDAGRAAQHEKSDDDVARQTDWELPNGGARVVKEATVQPPPPRQSSAFERQGLKTRVPESETPVAHATEPARTAAPSAPIVAPAVTAPTTTATAEPPAEEPAPLRVDVEADTMTDAERKHETPSAAHQPAAAVDHGAHADTPVADTDTAASSNEPAASAPQPSVHQDDSVAEHAHDDDNAFDEDDELAPEPFDVPEEEAVDDPRYEGLSEILWRRPLDAIAHLKEVMAERRVRKAEAREEARIRRLEARARRAEEKEKRRVEKEAAQQQAHEEALAQQAEQREEERRTRRSSAPRHAAAHHDDPLAPLDDHDPLFSSSSSRSHDVRDDEEEKYVDDYDRYQAAPEAADAYDDEPYAEAPEDEWEEHEAPSDYHPDVARARRHLVNGTQARETLASASEVIAIAVMARDGDTFDGLTLLKLMLACGLRYCPATRVFHRFETDDDHSPLQFSVIDTLKPGEFPLDDMDAFSTKGVWLLMPMPGAHELSAAFEAMYETARAIARYLEGELRDENQSVITAQTVEFSRQRVQEFERRAKLYQASH